MSWMNDDITFCNGTMKIKLNNEITHEIVCPIMNTCHRNVNQPKEHPWMSIFTEIPYNFETESCDFYWEISRKEKINKINKRKKK
jgi:hypothetical protein